MRITLPLLKALNFDINEQCISSTNDYACRPFVTLDFVLIFLGVVGYTKRVSMDTNHIKSDESNFVPRVS